jgi:GntR family transcriptional regulator / MocR family aminotransferase
MQRQIDQIPFIMLDDKNTVLPLFRQIYEAIRTAILSGKFTSNFRLPSTRGLANQLGVSRITVVNAYDQLFAEGYLEGKTGSGTFVAAHLPEEFLQTTRVKARKSQAISRQRTIVFSEYGNKLAANYQHIQQNHGASVFIPFQNGVSAVDSFPFDVWGRIAQKWHKNPTLNILGYGEPAGFQPLREAVASHLRSARGVSCTTEQVIITNGTQQALDLIARVFVSKNTAVWLEEPGYLGARDVFSINGAKVVPVPVDDEGFDLDQARKLDESVRLVYLTPSHQYPLGTTMSLARRLSLLEWARETESFIIEDDYNSDYRYSGRPLPSLQGLDRNNRVIYLGNFSKTIFPALRLGCLVVPTDLVDVLTSARALSDLHSPTIDQAILAEFIREGHFARHIRRMRGIYENRQNILVDEAELHLKELLEVSPAESGMHLIGWLPDGVSDWKISNEASKFNLKVAPISQYFAGENRARGGLVLGYTAFDERQISNGVKTLKEILSRN